MNPLLIFKLLIIAIPLLTIGTQHFVIRHKNHVIEELTADNQKKGEQIAALKDYILKIEKSMKQATAEAARQKAELKKLQDKKARVKSSAAKNKTTSISPVINDTIDELYREEGRN